MLKALRNRSIALLWCGQATSAIGDEIYRVALIWLAVNLVGADTGYLAAGQSAALLALSLFGGRWADRWDHFKTLIWVDAVRAVIVLIPVAVFYFRPVSLSVLWAVALALSALGAFFDPALQALLPRFAQDSESLKATTGLMSTTMRLARVAGPGIIGVLTAIVPTIHFFSVNALSFFISAISIGALSRDARGLRGPTEPRGETEDPSDSAWLSEFRSIRKHPFMSYVMTAKAVTTGAWNLAYGLGFALLAQKLAPNDVRAFGLIVASYGLGNLAAAIILGNLPRKNSLLLMFSGYICMGIGFALAAASPNLICLMISAAIAAVGGPLNDLPFLDIVQTRFPVDETPKVFRLRMAAETATTLVLLLIAPTLFKTLGIPAVIALSGSVMIATGGIGILKTIEEISRAARARAAGGATPGLC